MSIKKTRREFLKVSAKASMALPLLSTGFYSCNSKSGEKKEVAKAKKKKLNILILGGTSFLGPHQIAYALGRGHSITTFTRGKTKPTIYTELFDNVESLVGDRENDLKALENRKWDAVIDNSGRKVEWTRKTAELLNHSCKLYLYVSSTGVFYPYVNSDFTETSKVALTVPDDATDNERYEYDYGVMKANSELIAAEYFGPSRTIVVRPTYMLGPADRTDRFVHWPIRLSVAGAMYFSKEVLVPGKPDDPVQYVDVRDAAEFMIRLIEDENAGTYNVVGPSQPQGMLDFVNETAAAFGVDHKIVSIDDYDFLEKNEIYYSIPWIMPTDDHYGTARINNSKAKANGLTYRPLKQTVKDTKDWWVSDAVSETRRKNYLTNPNSLHNREASLLEAWKNR
ncbi:NAD-dependent epimerase/dehydratase family protein [Winogradskyella sp. 3972H.M.0a.05]|uniref:NAD-dependent epimerase/dehydratase family protein n=1 Tax=Winogradskyella sp. 3972H.M.0a.05 TaxID=2950277 RepID=UPI003393EA03